MSELKKKIVERFCAVFEQMNPTDEVPFLSNDTILLETGLSSLGFAILIADLEDELGIDPFTAMETAVYPQTFAELVAAYEIVYGAP